MRVLWVFVWTAAACGTGSLWAQQPEPAQQLVREVVYNELHDHDTHGYWRYWIEQRAPERYPASRPGRDDGGSHRASGRSQWPPARHAQPRSRADAPPTTRKFTLGSRRRIRRAYSEMKRIRENFALLPDAFSSAPGRRQRLPPPALSTQSRLSGAHHSVAHLSRHERQAGSIRASNASCVWEKTRCRSRLRLRLLGRYRQAGGWSQMQRVQVSATEWKTEQLEIHISGRAMIFNTIGRDTSELRGGFSSVPPGLDLAGGMRLPEQTDPKTPPKSLWPFRMSCRAFHKSRR